MSITTTLNNALSGLTAVSRIAENVSSNIANSMTDGYARRSVELGQQTIGATGVGVQIVGIARHVDPVLLANRRATDAELAQVSVTSDFLQTMESAIGLPDDPSSLSGRMTDFNTALIQAASRPDSEARLQAVVDTANSVTNQLNSVSDTIQSQRMQADQGIGHAVEFINSSLQQIADLNAHITRVDSSAKDSNSLIDQRQLLIDGISEYIPIREVPRDYGTIALFTPGGSILLDGRPAELGFTSVGVITADMTLDSGALSGLTVNGKSVSTYVESGPIAGGKLASLFDVRDVQAPGVQTRVDAVARDLIERFEDSSVDPTLSSGDPGFFTDRGNALDIADEIGLAGRIAVTTLVDPSAGGDLWRVRDGLGAASAGSAGDATLLNALTEAFGENRVPGSGDFIIAHSAIGVASDLLSGVSVARHTAETLQSFASAHNESLVAMELENGVDTDAEMQNLLLVEQAFAANAKVIATVDELIQTLIRM